MIRTTQAIHQNGAWRDEPSANPAEPGQCQLVFALGAREALEAPGLIRILRERYPQAAIAYASTAGEIAGSQVLDGCLVVTGLHFERTQVRAVCAHIGDHRDSADLGAHVMRELPTDGLAAVLVLSDGGLVNGSELARGLSRENPRGCPSLVVLLVTQHALSAPCAD